MTRAHKSVAYGVSALLALFTSSAFGCEFGDTSQTSSDCSQQASPAISIKENLNSATAFRLPVSLAILATLKQFNSTYEAGDRAGLSKLLAPTFSFIRILDGRKGERLGRGAFVATAGETIHVSLSHVRGVPEAKAIAAVAAVGKYTKYFSENEVYTFLFEPDNPTTIMNIIALPLYSDPYPDDGAKIVVVESKGSNTSIAAGWAKKAVSGPLASAQIDAIVEHNVSRIVRDERRYSAIAVFREPLKPGTNVVFEHQFNVQGKWLHPYVHSYIITELGRFHIIESGIHSGSPKGTKIAFRVYVNGKLIAEDVRQTK